MYVKFEVSMDNRQKAEEARRDRQKRDQIRMDKARRQYEETQERRAKVLGRNATVKQEMVERNLEQGKMVRAHKAAWEHLRQEAREQLFSETKKKVQAARSNDARLDELEAAADMAERNQATEERNARTLAARTFRANLAKSKRERAHEQREHEQRALSHRIKSVTTRCVKLPALERVCIVTRSCSHLVLMLVRMFMLCMRDCVRCWEEHALLGRAWAAWKSVRCLEEHALVGRACAALNRCGVS